MSAPQFYASLTGPLLGLYFPLPLELETRNEQGMALNTSKLKGLWCSIYSAAEVAEQLKKYGGQVLGDEYAEKLDYNHHDVEEIRNWQSTAMPCRRQPRRRPPAPKAEPKTADMAKLSVRLPPETKTLLDRLAAFTPATITEIIQAGTLSEARRREARFEKDYGRKLRVKLAGGDRE